MSGKIVMMLGKVMLAVVICYCSTFFVPNIPALRFLSIVGSLALSFVLCDAVAGLSRVKK